MRPLCPNYHKCLDIDRFSLESHHERASCTEFSSGKLAHEINNPLHPILYSKAVVYRGLQFLVLIQNIDCGHTLEPPHHLAEVVLACTLNHCFEQKL